MKKLVSILVVLCMALAMIPAFADEDFIGEWYLSEIRMGEESYSAAMFGMEMVFVLNEDGTLEGVTVNEGEEEPEEQTGTWEKTENGVIMTIDEETTEFVLEEDLLIAAMDDEGYMVLSREAPESFVLPETIPAESEDDFFGDWIPDILMMDDVALPVSMLGVEETITIEEGKMIVVANTIEEPQIYVTEFDAEEGALYAVLEGIEEPEESDVMAIELTEDGGLIMSSTLGELVTITYCVPVVEEAE